MDDYIIEKFIQVFPNLANTHFVKTSNFSEEYNCIAWAAKDTGTWWWPSDSEIDPSKHYWPKEVPKVVTVNAFQKAFETLGYQVCKSKNGSLRYCVVDHRNVKTHEWQRL